MNRRLAGWALWALIAGSLLSSLKVSHQQHETTDRLQETIECNTARYATLVDNLTIGRAVSTQSDAAKTQVFQGVGDLLLQPAATAADQQDTAAEYRQLFQQYKTAQAEVDAYRSANPYPDLKSPCTHQGPTGPGPSPAPTP